MISRDDDEPEDPRRFRRTLAPLKIEDAEKPPSLLRRMARMFRKKRISGPDQPESPPPGMAEGAVPPEGSLPEELERGPDDADPGPHF